MGGTGIANGTREAAGALRWWLETGVDVAIQETPRNWFERAKTPVPAKADTPAPLPDSLNAFRKWLSASPDAPLASASSRPVLPQGAEGAEVMILSEPPGRDELASGQPIGQPAAELLNRMLQAIGLTDQAYLANLACFYSPGARLSNAQMEECASAARRHVELARPKRLLLLGDAPSRTLLGKSLHEARGHVHKIESVRTIATFHPRHLLQRSDHKALAWKDLLLLIEEPS